ncbi:guanosine-5'-triphosphate, 3'-diphosphate pyrophosphatase [Campylobacter subantarcticus LMG 24377]|uniref:Guanosine-5'-triphosphate, 3'-diphosphate pyrophosphatase n=2 Tax=Campylobacter subantarcticus TaxID=497724 RepID=A0A0A8H8U5_9BACT|nr:Ppx/GppA phosphatase family protein [Campylobacter subantarcticus]EAJ1261363.1 guanosine-5'-triphosphate,3'-diphosphate pyrophosphatase [Campylobacter lari]AJC90080.1 guanosine-5'-triphosphate, 3'-diphosphate pyrophosphatase [Campylobacter subantarcticus LMG 24374]AJC91747.1 guanosine-5'-triphosphate, 3'-diphosphate pyrophosphatase [Campylobacter subantarcticus LMG 24377]EAL3939195.1 guanosine-5'-triphosphate,3'-diphosphate pyrophosphatase [Campylobacter lari]MPC00076.1 Ppx/GppA family phos
MAKKTAVIDLGSNSVRMVVFERTSRYGFFICSEYKKKVRLGENAYNNNKILQEEAMLKAEKALAYFKEKALKEKCRKIITVGTSALRDAPNAKEFITRIAKNVGLNIKCINGKTESFFGGLAVLNLLSNIQNAATIDIGGGSTELCLIKEGRIIDCISLDLGTVRLKEIFYDTKRLNALDQFIQEALAQVPKHFQNDNIIAIGGSLRALSNSIMKKNSYPLKMIHNFSYNFEKEKNHIEKIQNAENLVDFNIKKDRFDTIKEGCVIFLALAKKLKAKNIITSTVGVREGVFLSNLFQKYTKIKNDTTDFLKFNAKFPPNFNPSLKSLQDRFSINYNDKSVYFANKLFDTLSPIHKVDTSFKKDLLNAAKLVRIGEKINFYFANEHSAYTALNGLHFGFSHKEILLIATLLKANGKKINSLTIEYFKELLPNNHILAWLNFILALAKKLAKDTDINLDFRLKNHTLYIYSDKKQIYFSKEEIKKISKPKLIILAFNQKG